MTESQTPRLEVRRTVPAIPPRVFEAWTRPADLKEWWGPDPVTCANAEVDLRVGGRYRIANRFPDGKVLWIFGEFERVEPPRKLAYTWNVGTDSQESERVTVSFEPVGGATEVTVLHEGIPNRTVSEGHERGWRGCLDGLVEYLNNAGLAKGRTE